MMIWTLIALVAGLTWGFWLGRHFGEEGGYRRGLAEAPVDLRERALLSDHCPICGGTTAERGEEHLRAHPHLEQTGT